MPSSLNTCETTDETGFFPAAKRFHPLALLTNSFLRRQGTGRTPGKPQWEIYDQFKLQDRGKDSVCVVFPAGLSRFYKHGRPHINDPIAIVRNPVYALR